MKLELLALCLVLACGSSRPADEREEDTEAPPPADAGAEPCPPYQPDENGVVQLRRDCPLTIDYQIQ